MIFNVIFTYALLKSIICIQNLTDLSQCKVTHKGLSYVGFLSKTHRGIRCQRWSTKVPIYIVDDSIKDDNFPVKSKELAKNYCRNPTQSIEGPWCYTIDPNVPFENCDVPLCSFTECRMTGPGMEYSGTLGKSVSSAHCLKWSEDWPNRRVKPWNGSVVSGDKFPTSRFPDSGVVSNSYCRNPDGDIGGPWCFIETDEDAKEYRKDYCNVPFCDDHDCEVFSALTPHSYSHFISLDNTVTNITFALRIWDPDSTFNYTAHLVLAFLSVPATKDDMRRWGMGIELTISNDGIGLTIGTDDVSLDPYKNMLKATEYTNFYLTYHDRIVTLGLEGEVKPLYKSEVDEIGPLMQRARSSFDYYSMNGTNILWDFQFCDDENVCEEHTTFTPEFALAWPLRENQLRLTIQFHVRSYRAAIVNLRTNPVYKYPRILVMFGLARNVSKVVYELSSDVQRDLVNITMPGNIDYWRWSRFEILINGDELQVLQNVNLQFEVIMRARHLFVKSLRWFSIGSDYSITHWSLYCEPSEIALPELPECAYTVKEAHYSGTQWVTSLGHPCIPWFDKSHMPEGMRHDKLYIDGLDRSLNYCRNLLRRSRGPSCVAVTQYALTLEYCSIRRCQSLVCKTAGTANDYSGTISVTRSNRTCQFWTKVSRQFTKHSVRNDSLFPEGSRVRARNYCRNPTRSIAGAWCFTTDPRVVRDACRVRDCSKSENNIVLTQRGVALRFIYILPEWRSKGHGGGLQFSLKEWNPDDLDGILIILFSIDKTKSYHLYIGAESNEKLVLRYKDEEARKDKIVLHNTLPRLIPAGSWGNFWLQVPLGVIRLGYDSSEDPLLEYEIADDGEMFEPVFMSYQSLKGNVIGVHFPGTQCHAENTTTFFHTRIYSILIWRSDSEGYSNFSVDLRGTGIALIPLLQFPGDNPNYLSLTIGDIDGKYIALIKNDFPKATTLYSRSLPHKLISPDAWTRYAIFHTESRLHVYRDGKVVFEYRSVEPLLFYWASVSCDGGWILWTLNCDPPDVDGPPRDGGWSDWSDWVCSVTCGNGTGVRTRTCTNPKPNVWGRVCAGRSTETGKCNLNNCGDVSTATIKSIRRSMQNEFYSVVVAQNEDVTFAHPTAVIKTILLESPKSQVAWVFNGHILNASNGTRVTFEDDNVLIRNVSSEDSGVYVCLLYQANTVRTPIRVVTIAVESYIYDRTLHIGSSISIPCKAVYLAFVYSELSLKWLINSTVYANYGLTSLVAHDKEFVKRVATNHSGVWSCVVEQKALGFTWTTNMFKLHVKTNSLLVHLMEDKLTKPIFGKFQSEQQVMVALIVLAAVIFLIGLCCTSWFSKRKKALKRQTEKTKLPQPTKEQLGNMFRNSRTAHCNANYSKLVNMGYEDDVKISRDVGISKNVRISTNISERDHDQCSAVSLNVGVCNFSSPKRFGLKVRAFIPTSDKKYKNDFESDSEVNSDST